MSPRARIPTHKDYQACCSFNEFAAVVRFCDIVYRCKLSAKVLKKSVTTNYVCQAEYRSVELC